MEGFKVCGGEQSFLNSAIADLQLGSYMAAYEKLVEMLDVWPGDVLATALLGSLVNTESGVFDSRFEFDYSSVISLNRDNLSCEDLNRELSSAIKAESSLVWNKPGKATVNGAQTDFLNVDKNDCYRVAYKLIKFELQCYLEELICQKFDFSNFNLVLWGVVLRTSGYQDSHIHRGALLSGVYYVELPEFVGDEYAGALRFSWNLPMVPDLQSRTMPYFVKPSPGLIVIFPSFLWHGTVPFQSTDDRVCVAFDLMPRF